ncbi:MAG: hypothetical protein WC905_03010 [Patescibacteria group bacterium]
MEENSNPNGGAGSPEIQKSGNGWKNWVLAVIMILAGLFLGFILWGTEVGKAKAKARASEANAAMALSYQKAEQVKTAAYATKVADLEAEVATLKARPATMISSGGSSGEINALNKQIAYLQKALTQCLSGTKPATNTGASGDSDNSGASDNAKQNIAEPAFTAPSVASAKTQQASSNQLTEYYENGRIPFCIRLGGNSNRHIPHLAMRKYNFTDAESNGIGGFNWYLSGTSADLVGDYGCTSDGTYFVSTKIIDAYLIAADNGVIEILAKGFGWTAKQMTKFGDYYICSGK